MIWFPFPQSDVNTGVILMLVFKRNVFYFIAQGKERPQSSGIGCKDVGSCSQAETLAKKRDEVDKDLSLDIVLQQFKDCKREKKVINDSASDELWCGTTDNKPESRKRMRGLLMLRIYMVVTENA